MSRVECVEKVFGNRSLDEAASPIVHGDGNEGQTRYPAHGQNDAADGSPENVMMAQQIHQQDEADAAGAIVGTNKDAENDNGKEPGGQPGTACPALLPPMDYAKGKVAEKEGEEHVLAPSIEMTTMGQVEGYLGYQGEDKEIPTVFPSVVGMQESFYYEEAEYRECQPADTAQ